MNKQSVINFLKKYPMTILLAIIAINLFSISSSLKVEQEINRQKLLCIKYKKGYIKYDNFDSKLKVRAEPKARYELSSREEVCNAILGS